MKTTLLIVENRETILTEFTKLLVGLAWNRSVDNIIFWEGKRKPIWYMRRELIRQALQKTDCTHVLFLDTDVIPPTDFLERLRTHEKDMVSGVYYGINGEPCSRKNDKPFIGEDLQEVDVFAMGLSLLSRKLCEEVMYPEPSPASKTDADVDFCKLAKEKGYQPYQDFSIRGSHLLLNSF